MELSTKNLIYFHSAVLVVCSLIGFVGFYLQYNKFQLTAFIPGSVALLLLIVAKTKWHSDKLQFIILFLVTIIFGIILTRMSIKFVAQEFQPLRKRIYFPVMALSSIATVMLMFSKRHRGNRLDY
jgi:hypothetical protein